MKEKQCAHEWQRMFSPTVLPPWVYMQHVYKCIHCGEKVESFNHGKDLTIKPCNSIVKYNDNIC